MILQPNLEIHTLSPSPVNQKFPSGTNKLGSSRCTRVLVARAPGEELVDFLSHACRVISVAFKVR